MSWNISRYIYDDYIIISIDLQNPQRNAVAEISKLGDSWFFNRLFVPPEHRRKGIANALMEELVKILDAKCITLRNEINPYGDMTYEQLLAFYKKFGFKKTEEGFVRYPKTKKQELNVK
ncbi:GNAT family N-acetyltransferase [Calderihabitans maritimus]|nr:GNAT family N-acetyltransferase [Calderihabitans maritimus]